MKSFLPIHFLCLTDPSSLVLTDSTSPPSTTFSHVVIRDREAPFHWCQRLSGEWSRDQLPSASTQKVTLCDLTYILHSLITIPLLFLLSSFLYFSISITFYYYLLFFYYCLLFLSHPRWSHSASVLQHSGLNSVELCSLKLTSTYSSIFLTLMIGSKLFKFGFVTL